MPPNANYNCAGHVWANRRTCIFERGEWDKILAQDGYVKLVENVRPMAGDLAIYRLPDYGIVHVGEILRFDGEGVQVPVVLSKWGDWTGEYEHKEHDIPFRAALPGYMIEYWTERFRGHTP